MAIKIYEFHVDCGRGGDLMGLFAVNEIGEAKLRKAVDNGEEVYFDECLGKHSEISGPLEESEVTLKVEGDDAATVARIMCGEIPESGTATLSGYNPLHYLQGGE